MINSLRRAFARCLWLVTTLLGLLFFAHTATLQGQSIGIPSVTSVGPGSVPIFGGTLITITGSGFTGATNVTVGARNAGSITVVDDTTITCLHPGGTAGAKSVLVTTPAGTNAANSALTYVNPPAVTLSSPNSGSIAGGTSVTLTITALTGATAVTFDGSAATPAKPQQFTSPDQVPEGLQKSDWQSIRTAHQAWEHSFLPLLKGGWQVSNHGQPSPRIKILSFLRLGSAGVHSR